MRIVAFGVVAVRVFFVPVPPHVGGASSVHGYCRLCVRLQIDAVLSSFPKYVLYVPYWKFMRAKCGCLNVVLCTYKPYIVLQIARLILCLCMCIKNPSNTKLVEQAHVPQ